MSEYGLNMRKLLAAFIALESVPPGGGLAAGLRFVQDSEYRKQVLARVDARLRAAIEVVKTAPDNPYKNDEEIAAAILAEIERNKQNGLEEHS